MHCNSFIFLVSGLVGIAVAPPPPHRPEITTMGPHKTAATLSISKVIAHKTASSSIPKATAHKTASSSISKVTALTHSTDNGITTVGDVVTATIIEIGMYPPEEVWTTIHRGSSSSTAKAQETSQVIKAVEKSNSSMKVKVQQTEKPANKEKATKTAKVKVAPTHVAPSTCATYYPSIMRQISETFPDILQEDTANTTKAFHVGQSISFSDKVKFNRLHQYIGFESIATGSWDCQLMVSWPDVEHGGLNVKASSQRGSSATSGVSLEVYSASYEPSAFTDRNSNGPFSTWNTMLNAIKAPGNRQLPASDSGKGQEKSDASTAAQLTYFGTVPVNPGEYGLTINSEACPAAGKLQYLFEIPTTDSREASVSFLGTKEKGAGVYMIANC